MNNVAWIVNRLEENKKQIAEATQKLDRLHESKRSLTEQLQTHCSHPPEYTSRDLTNPRAAMQVAEHYQETCVVCGKVLESYSIIAGKKHYGERDVRRGE